MEIGEKRKQTLQQDRNSMIIGCEKGILIFNYVTNTKSDTISLNQTQSDIDKKNSLTREYFRSLWYIKSSFKAMLTPVKDRSHWTKILRTMQRSLAP